MGSGVMKGESVTGADGTRCVVIPYVDCEGEGGM